MKQAKPPYKYVPTATSVTIHASIPAPVYEIFRAYMDKKNLHNQSREVAKALEWYLIEQHKKEEQ